MGPLTRLCLRLPFPPAAALGALVVVAVAACEGTRFEDPGPWRVTRPAGTPRSSLQLRVVLESAGAGTERLADADGTPLNVLRDAILTERDVTGTEVARSVMRPYYAVHLHVTPEAARRLRQESARHVGRQVAIVIDGKVLLAPQIRGEFSSPAAIEGSYSREEATRIAQQLAP